MYPPVIGVVGFALWLAVYESGIHATTAGVDDDVSTSDTRRRAGRVVGGVLSDCTDIVTSG